MSRRKQVCLSTQSHKVEFTTRKNHDAYVAAAVPTLPAEAKLLSFDLGPEVIEEPVSHPRTVIIEFPTRESFLAWYDSPGVDWRMIIYGKVGHSFTNPAVDALGMAGLAYDRIADQASWRAMLDFLGECGLRG